jgi:hypothetical protein
MLPFSSLLQNCAAPCCSYSLQIIGDCDQPEYYIGQLVLHRMKRSNGEILHPVQIIGLYWTGIDWEYAVSLPPDHPQFVEEDHEWDFLNYWLLELM